MTGTASTSPADSQDDGTYARTPALPSVVDEVSAAVSSAGRTASTSILEDVVSDFSKSLADSTKASEAKAVIEAADKAREKKRAEAKAVSDKADVNAVVAEPTTVGVTSATDVSTLAGYPDPTGLGALLAAASKPRQADLGDAATRPTSKAA